LNKPLLPQAQRTLALWYVLSVFLSHALVGTLIFGFIAGSTALVDRVNGFRKSG
jgi:hypothetical protein